MPGVCSQLKREVPISQSVTALVCVVLITAQKAASLGPAPCMWQAEGMGTVGPDPLTFHPRLGLPSHTS